MTEGPEAMVTGFCGQFLLTIFTFVIFIEWDGTWEQRRYITRVRVHDLRNKNYSVNSLRYYVSEEDRVLRCDWLTQDCIISLELIELRVPANVALGTRAALSCRWALGPADVLYSVKWYKDGKEFFRHVPRDHEPRRKFPLPGVDVEQSDASGSSLVLSVAVSGTGGRYRCEVSGEGPLFPTVSEHADLEVVVLPDHGPVLSGLRPRYRLGNRVEVNCTSGRSRPPSHLLWYINGEPASPTAVLPPFHRAYEDLETTTLSLNFILTEHHFKNNGLKVKCLATLASLYWRSKEESAQLEKMKVYDAQATTTSDVKIPADRAQSNTARLFSSSSTSIVILLLSAFCRYNNLC